MNFLLLYLIFVFFRSVTTTTLSTCPPDRFLRLRFQRVVEFMVEIFDTWFRWFVNVLVWLFAIVKNLFAIIKTGRTNSRAVNVWFLVDTGSPFTCLSSKSLEALMGMGNVTHTLYSLSIQVCFLFHRIYCLISNVQDQRTKIECQVSKAHFAEVNILGADAMQQLELSIVVDWRKKDFKLVNQWMLYVYYGILFK